VAAGSNQKSRGTSMPPTLLLAAALLSVSSARGLAVQPNNIGHVYLLGPLD